MTTVRARWFPATILLDGVVSRGRYVLLAEGGDMGGLHVWSRPGEVADLHVPVDWSATEVPSERAARNGVNVRLVDGRLAVVTPNSGCRCGQLGRWAGPSWAHTVAVRG